MQPDASDPKVSPRNPPRAEGVMGKLSKRPVARLLCRAACSGLLSLLLSPMLVWAATPSIRAACDQCEEADRFVRLQQVSDESRTVSSRQFKHPLMLTSQEWTTLLTTLQVQRQAEGLLFRDPPGPVIPAFTSEDIGFLSATLSQAFAQVRPDEMVVFGLSHLSSYRMTEITTGGWFVEGASLRLVLANYRKVVTMPGTRQLLWDRPMRPDAGPAYDLVGGHHHQTMVRESNMISGLFSSAPSELDIAYPAILLGTSGEASTPQDSSASPRDVAPFSMSIEDRLRALKRFHDQGLISEEEYRIKKQQLLEKL